MSDLGMTNDQRSKLAQAIGDRADRMAAEGRVEGECGGDPSELLYGAMSLAMLADDIRSGRFP